MTVINAGAAESQISSRYGSLIIKNNGNAEDIVMMDHQYMEHILAMETQTQTTLPLVCLVSQLMVAANSSGLSAGDISAVLKLYAELARISMGAARGD